MMEDLIWRALLEHPSRHLANHEALLAYSVHEAWYRYMLHGHDGGEGTRRVYPIHTTTNQSPVHQT
jgi:hypothetical protein